MKTTTRRITADVKNCLNDPATILELFTRIPEDNYPIRTNCAGNDGFYYGGGSTTGELTIYPYHPNEQTVGGNWIDYLPPNSMLGYNPQYIPPTFKETVADGIRTLTMNVPGCGKEDVRILLKSRTLRARAEYGNTIYDCSTCLSLSVDLETIVAECKNGILTLKMKDKEVHEREIPVG